MSKCVFLLLFNFPIINELLEKAKSCFVHHQTPINRDRQAQRFLLLSIFKTNCSTTLEFGRTCNSNQPNISRNSFKSLCDQFNKFNLVCCKVNGVTENRKNLMHLFSNFGSKLDNGEGVPVRVRHMGPIE